MPTQRNAATRLVGPLERGGEASPACIGTSKSCHTNTPEHARNAATRLVRPPECGRAELRQCARKTEKTTKKPLRRLRTQIMIHYHMLLCCLRDLLAQMFSLSLSPRSMARIATPCIIRPSEPRRITHAAPVGQQHAGTRPLTSRPCKTTVYMTSGLATTES